MMDLFSQIDTTEREEILSLRKELEEANHKYYVENAPTLSDYEFDLKLRRLQDLEAQYPDMHDPNSPTQKVGSDLGERAPHEVTNFVGDPAEAKGEKRKAKGFEQVAHKYPMLSLSNSYSREEIADWISKLPDSVEIVCELKYDGLSISLWYEHGILTKALTRGDGTKGDNVIDNIRTITSIPTTLHNATPPDFLELRGEVLLPWAAFERLNKERDLVGIYLSAHPLDEYRIILEDVCSVHLIDMQEVLDKKEERDVSIGGVVTATRSGFTKSNKPFGITKLEDFSGTYEIALFGDDWMRFNSFMKEGYFLFIRGRISPRKFGPDTYELKVGTVELLPDVKDTLLQSITITIQAEYLTEEMADDLITILKESPGKTELYFQIKDGEGQHQANLKSKTQKVSATNKLVNYLKGLEGVDYKFN